MKSIEMTEQEVMTAGAAAQTTTDFGNALSLAMKLDEFMRKASMTMEVEGYLLSVLTEAKAHVLEDAEKYMLIRKSYREMVQKLQATAAARAIPTPVEGTN